MRRPLAAILNSLLLILLAGFPTAASVGVNWGWDSSTRLPPSMVVAMLQSNNVARVRIPEADTEVMEALSGTRIGLMLGVPNESLQGLNASRKAAEDWVHDNVTRYVAKTDGGGIIRIEYICLGNDPLHQSYGHPFRPFVLGAAINLQAALNKATLAEKIKIVVPCGLDIIQSVSGLPSDALFMPDLNRTMIELLSFLVNHSSPFVVNMNLFSTLTQNKNYTLEKALFQLPMHPFRDGNITYNNTFDLSVDVLVSSLSRVGFDSMDIIVGEIGWPTDGAPDASPTNAEIFMKGLLSRLDSKDGTPLRPHKLIAETYISSLLDEDHRDIAAGNYQRHLGIFTFDGQAKYKVVLGQGVHDLVSAVNVPYLASKWCVVDNSKDITNASASMSEACKVADCTSLMSGGSCSNISWPGNISYALNSFYQQNGQRSDSCDFGGLGLITTVDPSIGDCSFLVGLRPSLASTLFKTGSFRNKLSLVFILFALSW